MVYIRNKKVKGIQYAYLVQSKWDQESNTSRQIIIKYLGRTSEITLDYIPPEYRDVPKIIAFISAYGPSQKERERPNRHTSEGNVQLVERIQYRLFGYNVQPIFKFV